MKHPGRGSLHHVELWVPDLPRARSEWDWLLGELGYQQFQDWEHGRSWQLGGTYLVIEQSPALTASAHDRLRPGLNHLAFHAGSRASVDALTTAGPSHGWTLLFPDRHPHAGGPGHYAAYLTSTDGFEVELVADEHDQLNPINMDANCFHADDEDQPIPEPTAAPITFIRAYEQATNSHDITRLAPLIAADAVYWFSDGSHRGREAVLAAIAETFATIRDEVYRIDELEWIAADGGHAICRYRFAWTGIVNGEPRSGRGRGTNVLINTDGTWQMLHEHLSA